MQDRRNKHIKNSEEDKWVRCRKCNHKLFKDITPPYKIENRWCEAESKHGYMNVYSLKFGIEIKCSSCKEINVL